MTTHKVINPEDRQGPCPEGFHVPSAGEWSHLLELYYATQEGITLQGSSLKYTSDSNFKFVNDLNSVRGSPQLRRWFDVQYWTKRRTLVV